VSTIALPQRGENLLTHSRRSCLAACPRKHYYRYELGVRRGGDAKPLRRGSAVHKGLEKLATALVGEDWMEPALEAYGTLPAWANTDDAVLDWMGEAETVKQMLLGYANHHGQSGGREIKKYIAVELPFELPIVNPDTGKPSRLFKVAGKIDGIVELADGRLAVLEHKTASDDLSPGSVYWQRLDIDSQISLYYIAARSMGYDVQTVLYDVLKTPELSPSQVPLVDAEGIKIVHDANGQRVRTKDGKKWRETGDSELGYIRQCRPETMQEFGARLATDIASRPDYYYQRREIPRLESDLDEFRRELWAGQEELRTRQKEKRWSRTTAACVSYSTPCEYLSICRNGIDPANPPSGFTRVEHLHPELKGEAA